MIKKIVTTQPNYSGLRQEIDYAGRGRFVLALLTMLLTPLSSVNAANDAFWRLPIEPQGTQPDWTSADIFQLSPDRCGLCHPRQYAQWKTSLHAQAFGPGLAGQLSAFDEETINDCLNCHSPRSEQQSNWRDYGLASLTTQQGVDCIACHMRGQQRFGAHEIALTPHGAVGRNPLFEQSAFCSACHQFDDSGLSVNGKPLENTWREWRQSRYAKQGIQCQNCHMAQKNHRFRGIHDPKMTRQGLSVRAIRTAEGIVLNATNRGAGHALPTYVTPEIHLKLVSSSGRQKRHIIRRHMHWDEDEGWREISDTRLLPDQSIELKLKLSQSETARAVVQVFPDADYHDRVYPTLFKLLAEDLSPAEKKLLKKAQDRTRRSGYILYQLSCPAWSGVDEGCVETH